MLLLLLLLLLGCGGGTSTPVSTAELPGIRLESPAECAFQVPEEVRTECGYLVVPRDRRGNDGATLKLHYAIFRSTSANPRPDPVVYLSGGPGFGALQTVPFTFNRRFLPFLAGRDLIMFDQRGTGLSEPALDCPEYTRTVYDLLDRDLSSEDADAEFLAALLECHDRLVREGVDPEAYTTVENATDVKDLRLALGYDQWNLYGVSYGTKLALTTMRDHPQGIRSAILDSPFPLQVDLDTSVAANARRAFDVLFQGCATHVVTPGTGMSCAEAYPDLQASFLDTAASLNDDPAAVSLTHPLTGETFPALLDGDGLVSTVFQSLYSTELLPLLPLAIAEAHEGRFDALSAIQGSFLAELDFASVGMQLSVQCGEETRFVTREELAAAAQDFPELGDVFAREVNLDICELWGSRRADPTENEPVSSPIPTLVLSGEYDPVTPPAWGRLAASGLDNAFFYEFRGIAHGASGTGGCPLEITLEFLDDPGSEPDSSCLARMRRPDFLVLR